MVDSAVMVRLDPKSLLDAVGRVTVRNRRVRRLAGHLAQAIPTRGTVLDIGAGEGLVAEALMQLRRDLRIEGVDVSVPPHARIALTPYDGTELPFADQSFDYVTIIDQLHRASEPAVVLAEAARVARYGVVVKDRLADGALAIQTLRFMDWVESWGRAAVPPQHYLTRDEWQNAYYRARLAPVSNVERLALYPPPFSWLFDRNLHFVALLRARAPAR